VVLEFGPFGIGRRPVLSWRAQGAAAGQECLVVADEVVVEDGLTDPRLVCTDKWPSRAAPMWMGSPLLTSSVAKILRKS